MKKQLTLIFLLSVFIGVSQAKISVGIFQDAKLLVMNDEHKNIAPTMDAIINVNLETKQKSIYYHSLQLFYNHAELYSGYYKRYGVNSMWTFNKWIRNIDVSLGFGIASLKRHNVNGVSYQLCNETMYKLNDWLKVGLKYELNRRNDLRTYKNNVYFGVIIN